MARVPVVALVLTVVTTVAIAEDKNGVSPMAISLPSGPGSVNGLGESFQPQLNNGSGQYSIPIEMPSGPGVQKPELTLRYNTGLGNSYVGLGWTLSLPAITRSTDDGLPLYVDVENQFDDDHDGVIDNTEELDRFNGFEGEELILVDVAADTWRSENESRFVRYQRLASGWRATQKNGIQFLLGTSPASQIVEPSTGRIYSWLLERVTDTNGNIIEYRYATFPDSTNQKYLEQIRWGGPDALLGAFFTYEDRHDWFTDFRPCYPLLTTMRLVKVDIVSRGAPRSGSPLSADFLGDGETEQLIRRYRFDYHPDNTLPVSLLEQVVLIGTDGQSEFPATKFSYTPWILPTDLSNSIIYSCDDPQVALDNPNVELVDLNGDALPDLLSTIDPSQHWAYANLGVGSCGQLMWNGVGVAVGGSIPAVAINSGQVHLSDQNADGLADLPKRNEDGSIEVFGNSGTIAWAEPSLIGLTGDAEPVWPYSGPNGLFSRPFDLSHDRFGDILDTGASDYLRVWLRLRGSRGDIYSAEIRPPALTFDQTVFRFDELGARIADLNGDRLRDVAWIRNADVVYWPSCGYGEFAPPVRLELFSVLDADDLARAGFADVNGDGISDLTIVRPTSFDNEVHYWLNYGTAFGPRMTVPGLPPAHTNDSLRWADMNGNGSVDILISNSLRPQGSREMVIDFLPGIRPFLLASINNGLGTTTSILYESSVDQMLRANSPWTSTIPMPIPVVAQLTENNGLHPPSVRTFEYRNPFFDGNKQEFRGFTEVREVEIGDASAETKIVTRTYDTGLLHDCLKGSTLTEVTTDGLGASYHEIENQWMVLPPFGLGCYAFKSSEEKYIFERTDVPVQVRTDFLYDQFGNMIEEHKYGIVESGDLGASDDEVITLTQYVYDLNTWIADRPQIMQVTDLLGAIKSQTRYYYDGQPLGALVAGNCTREEQWLGVEDRWIATKEADFDSFGNAVENRDGNGNRRTMDIDPWLHSKVVAERIHLDSMTLEMTADYDLGFGLVNKVIHFWGEENSFTYDAFGRLASIQRAGGAAELYEYLHGPSFSRIRTSVLENINGDTYDTYSYYDGFGRLLATIAEGEAANWRVLDGVTYNSRKTVARRWLPYHQETYDYLGLSPSEAFTRIEYDALAREAQSELPDGNVTATIRSPLSEEIWDENDFLGLSTPTLISYDGLNRVRRATEVHEGSLCQTQYKWSSLGDLEAVTDGHGNVRLMAYDSLRRLIFSNDPNQGQRTFDYDDASNLIRTTDAKGQVIERTHDAANRLATVNYLDSGGGPSDPIDLAYFYDSASENVDFGDGTMGTATNTRGRLASVRDLSGEEHLSYDSRGKVAWVAKKIKNPETHILETYTTSYNRDLMDRGTDLYFPDGDHVRYQYDESSYLDRIDGGPTGRVIVSSIAYEPTMAIREMMLGNGVARSQAYDVRDRLIELLNVNGNGIENLHYVYSHDSASNITSIVDLRPTSQLPASDVRRNSQVFTYDDLNRLSQVRYARHDDIEANLGQIDYEYDMIGNLIQLSTAAKGSPGHIDDRHVGVGSISHGGTLGSHGRVGRSPGDPEGPHAASETGNGSHYEYDDNGNIVGIDGAQLAWDFEDHLIQYVKGDTAVSFVYDYSGRRVIKSVSTPGESNSVLYPNKVMEVREGNESRKYVIDLDSGRRIAQVKGTLDPTRNRIQRLRLKQGWNLISVCVATPKSVAGIFGMDVDAFEWTDSGFLTIDPSEVCPVGVALWISCPSSRTAIVAGAYDPSDAVVVFPDGGHFLGWNRLEPFVGGLHSDAVDVHAYESGSWAAWFAQAPAFVSDLTQLVSSGQALFLKSADDGAIRPAELENYDVLFFHEDHLGSVDSVSDSNGDVIQQTLHYPYGHPRVEFISSVAPYKSSYSYVGKERDKESGLHDLGARLYLSYIGHFIKVDPLLADFNGIMIRNRHAEENSELNRLLREPRRWNMYGYGINNPITWLDSSGTWSWTFDKDQVPCKDTVCYGNWAGAGSKGGKPIDYVDFTAMVHDNFYDVTLADQEFFGDRALAPDALFVGMNAVYLSGGFLLDPQTWTSDPVDTLKRIGFSVVATTWHTIKFGIDVVFAVGGWLKDAGEAIGDFFGGLFD